MIFVLSYYINKYKNIEEDLERGKQPGSDMEETMAALGDLLKEVSYECVRGTVERDITDVIYDSRKVVEGSLFVCIPGAKADGHKFAADAVRLGSWGPDPGSMKAITLCADLLGFKVAI